MTLLDTAVQWTQKPINAPTHTAAPPTHLLKLLLMLMELRGKLGTDRLAAHIAALRCHHESRGHAVCFSQRFQGWVLATEAPHAAEGGRRRQGGGDTGSLQQCVSGQHRIIV